MDHSGSPHNADDSEELISPADKQLEERLADAAETPSPLKPALGITGTGDGRGKP